MNIIPVKIDIPKLRSERQKESNKQLLECLVSGDKPKINNLCNVNELTRYLSDLDISLDTVINKCHEDSIYLNTIVRCISKNSSRQGDIDETEQIRICNNISSNYGIFITKLKKNEYRPMKNIGNIVDRKTCIDEKININTQCLKSFDGRISGNKEGWLFLKAVFGSGGHQDNVFREAVELCEWVKLYKSGWIAVVIDTDQIIKLDKLKNSFSDVDLSVLFIGTSYEFQQFIIDM